MRFREEGLPQKRIYAATTTEEERLGGSKGKINKPAASRRRFEE